MAKTIYHLSVENAFYFSFASFVIVWAAGFLFNLLEKTPGQLNLGVVIIIVLSLVLVMFLLALTNIILGDEGGQHGFVGKLAAVFLFALISSIILLVLGAVFFFKF